MPSRRQKLKSPGGAYALVIELKKAVRLPDRFGGADLPPGCYVYAGSARGPGGIRARIARHLRRQKKRHWHVDHLTVEADAIRPFAFAGGSECAITAALLKQSGFTVPLAGFGSSDCKTCRSHLLSAPDAAVVVGTLSALQRRLTAPAGA